MDGQEAGSQFENHPVDSYLSNILCSHPFEQLEPRFLEVGKREEPVMLRLKRNRFVKLRKSRNPSLLHNYKVSGVGNILLPISWPELGSSHLCNRLSHTSIVCWRR